ncbi:MAG: PD-(D/E)XK nuclease family protein [Erysipelotrichaceae bacterium]|nr:PD-(D/E)XK nuclease family protein [Erysipelotrichaceae bacterium]
MERFIYSDVLNQTEYLRSLAKLGIDTFGLRVLNTFDLASYICLKANIKLEGRYIANNEADFILLSECNKDVSYLDAKNICAAINSFRDTGNGNTSKELEPYLDSNFKKKKEVILESFDKYNDYKAINHLYDLYDILYLLIKSDVKLDKEVIYYKDIPTSEFALKVFNNIFNLKEEVYPFSKLNKDIKITKTYGKDNEVEHLFNVINQNKYPLDECLVVLTNGGDLSYLIDYMEKYHLKYTSSIGYPFSRTNVGKLIKTIIDMSNSLYNVDAYKTLFSLSCFNTSKYLDKLTSSYDIKNFIKYAGWLRLGFDRDVSIYKELYSNTEIYNSLMLLKEEYSKGLLSFIKDNVIEDEYHYEAINILEKYDELCNKYNVNLFDILGVILNSNVHQHISTSGAIHIASLNQAFSSIRRHVFILGLDSSFPGQPTENFLIYDEEYKAMKAYRYISKSLIKEKENLMNLLISSSEQAYLSYPYFDNVDLKNKNQSSVITSKNVPIDEFSYTDNVLDKNHHLIDLYNKGAYTSISLNHNEAPYSYEALLDKVYTPSTFENYFSNKVKFILETLFNISLEDKDDPYLLLAPTERGTLFHNIVMYFEKDKISEEDFIKKGLKMFDDFFLMKPPLIKEALNKEREIFTSKLKEFYKKEPGNRCIYSEKKLVDVEINGLHFEGRFDRLEKTDTNKYILVDYKTGGTVKHIDDDIFTSMQGVIYMKMIELKLGIKVDRCEFRYPFADNKAVKVMNTPEIMDELYKKIEVFKDDIKDANFITLDKASFIDQYRHLISLIKGLGQ